MTNLKACPFCGEEPNARDTPSGICVACFECRFQLMEEGWSRRTPGPATQAMIAHCKNEQAEYRSMIEDPEMDIINAFIAEWEDQ